MSNPGFLFAEDAAIKYWFSNLTVVDDRDPARPVRVFFRYPDNETERTYPFITIELIDVVHATTRQHSEVTLYGTTSTAASNQNTGPNNLAYFPSEASSMTGYSTAYGELVATQDFVPVDLLYQVSTFTRSALHDRQLASLILRRLALFRGRHMVVPEDGTLRRIQLLDWITSDLLDPEAGYRKRIFRKIYTIQLSAEMTQTDLESGYRTKSVKTDIINSYNHSKETVTTS